MRMRTVGDMAENPDDGRTVSLAYHGLEELPLRSLGRLETIRHLDLSHNKFSYPCSIIDCMSRDIGVASSMYVHVLCI